jgi:hypothetical protein
MRHLPSAWRADAVNFCVEQVTILVYLNVPSSGKFSPHMFKYLQWHIIKNVLDKTVLDTTALGTNTLDKIALV